MNVEPIQDEHNVLDDNQYIADVLAEFKAVKQSKVWSGDVWSGGRAW